MQMSFLLIVHFLVRLLCLGCMGRSCFCFVLDGLGQVVSCFVSEMGLALLVLEFEVGKLVDCLGVMLGLMLSSLVFVWLDCLFLDGGDLMFLSPPLEKIRLAG